MENFSIKIITQKSCKKCENLKNELLKQKIPFESFDAFSNEGKKITKKHLIMCTPTALFLSDDDKELARAQNLQEIQEILENFAK